MADCTWTRIYENDANGGNVYGTVTDLADAVKAGADVQVRYYRGAGDSGFRRVEWHRTSHAVTVADPGTSGTPIVSCMFTDIPDTELAAGSGRRFLQPFAFEWQVFNTTGSRHTVKFNQQTSAVESEFTDNLGIAWYVRCYQHRPPWWQQVVGRVSDLLTRR